jgi:hypothetical protein
MVKEFISMLMFCNLIFRLVDFCMQKVQMLLEHDIKPILIFDGSRLEMKESIEKSRHL